MNIWEYFGCTGRYKNALESYLLSTCIRVSAGSSIRPLLYIVGVCVMYKVVVGVYIGMGILCTIVSGVILFVFIVLIRVCVFMWGRYLYSVYMYDVLYMYRYMSS